MMRAACHSFKIGLSLVMIAVLCASGCRTSAPVGVRPEFKRANVRRVIMTPFYQLGAFGATEEQQQSLREAYQARTERWLIDHDFEVMSAQEFEQHLTQAGAWQDYQDGVFLRESLSGYFEPGAIEVASAEIATLQELSRKKALPEGELLFAEIVYQSEAECIVSAPARDRYSTLIVSPEAKKLAPPRPCVISHLHAKLVDPPTGSTMWFNKHLVEYHVATRDVAAMMEGISLVIDAVFGGKKGIIPLN